MKCLIMQHFTGKPGELELLSFDNMQRYAERIGAEYKFIAGDVFVPGWAPPCQKMIMLDPVWDDYDCLVMTDSDMFAVNGLTENVFTDITGVGIHAEVNTLVFQQILKRHPTMSDARYAFWGGCLWRLSRDLRKTLRRHSLRTELSTFAHSFHDEGMMHWLAVQAKITHDPIPERWSYSSYLPDPASAAIIHVRTRRDPQGLVRKHGVVAAYPRLPKVPKIENYRVLHDKGIIT